MSAIAIITARGGSKRIPRKNIKSFCGNPIISYSIRAALDSRCFDEVMVSTDDLEIAHIAEIYGAHVPFMRSENASNDEATTADAIKDVLTMYIEKENQAFDTFCCIYPTAPFVTADKLQKGMKMLDEHNVDSVVPVVQFSFPPQRGFIIKNHVLQFQFPQYASARSQDLIPIYHDCGQFYICRTQAFMQSESLITEKTLPIIMPEEEVQDIDNISDWNIAEIKFKRFILKNEEI